jgi:hypothetical protein
MNPQTEAVVVKWATGALLAFVIGALAAAPTLVEDGKITGAELVIVLGAGLLALRIWAMRQMADLGTILGVPGSLPARRVSDPALEEGDPIEGLLVKTLIVPLSTARGLVSPSPIEIRKFSDPQLQEAVEKAFRIAEANGDRSGGFFNVNVAGEIRTGVAVKLGGHLSIGGFLAKAPGKKLEGMAEFTFTWK